ncbi:MAG: hypothetical protein ABSG84_05125 [Acidobacteriaceae bacterium]
MKRIDALNAVAMMLLGALAASAQVTVATGDGGKTVIETVTNLRYGTVTMTWAADANIAGGLRPDSPYWVPGINPDGSMPLSVANEFIAKLNANAYLGITTWSLPITVYDDASCSAPSSGGRFAYDCGEAVTGSTGYPYSELGNLFYNVLGGTAHNNIKLVHGPNYVLFNRIQPYLYWSQTAQSNNLKFSNDFWFQNGFQGTEDEYDSMFVIPVSVTATKPGPSGLFEACADIPTPATCTAPLPGLGLTTTVYPVWPSLQPRWDRQLIYDPVTNVAYLANANLAATLPADSPYYVSGINPDGSMDQATLADFLAALNNPAHPFMGLTGWNVPTTVAGGKNPDCSIQVVTANPDIGYNCDGAASDLGELYYNQFGIAAGHTVNETWSWQRWYFYNLMPDYYWQCNPAPGQPASQCAHTIPNGEIPSFSFQSGYEGVQSDPNDLFVMLAVPGDEIPHDQRWWW